VGIDADSAAASTHVLGGVVMGGFLVRGRSIGARGRSGRTA